MNGLSQVGEIKLTGRRVAENFGYLECTDGELDFTIIKNIVMNGHHDGNILYVVRSHVDAEWCREVSGAFDREISNNGGSREVDDYVLTKQIGATQFSRSGMQYIREALRVGKSSLDLLHEVPEQVVETLFLNRYLEEQFLHSNIHFGPSRYKNGWPSFATFRRWLDNGLMSLMPHEDKAQLACAKEDAYEIHAAQTIVSFNVCLEADDNGGELVVWNFEPDDRCRDVFGVSKTGYPYHPDKLQGVESVAVRLQAGDVYFMNACHVHGVRSNATGRRLTAGRFIGKITDKKVVFWT